MTFKDPPDADNFDDLREQLMQRLEEVREQEKELIRYIDDGQYMPQDIAEVLASQGQRINDIELLLLESMSDKDLQQFLPDYHKLSGDDDG